MKKQARGAALTDSTNEHDHRLVEQLDFRSRQNGEVKGKSSWKVAGKAILITHIMARTRHGNSGFD